MAPIACQHLDFDTGTSGRRDTYGTCHGSFPPAGDWASGGTGIREECVVYLYILFCYMYYLLRINRILKNNNVAVD